MVTRYLTLLLLMAYPLVAQEVKVSSQIERQEIVENQPVKGLVTISHKQKDKVDEASFLLGGHPLKVEKIQEAPSSSADSITVSFYRFTLDGQPKGLQLLPEISVKVGSQVYKAPPVVYEVGQLSVAANQTSGQLKFEALVQGNSTLYPGQRTKLTYRYTYTDTIELNEEELPLLEAKGLQKVGAKDIKDFTQGKASIREISQEVEAATPGEFTFGPSTVSGYVYRQTLGRRNYLQPQLKSVAPAITITVKPFPEEGKPASFNGAIGPFSSFNVKLASAPKVNVGDKILLEAELEGSGQLNQAPMPNLCCQPGYSGIFRASDLPPVEEVKDGKKSFVVELRPLSSEIKEIPPIEFSYFDPETVSYGTLMSAAIPITVEPSRQTTKPAESKPAIPAGGSAPAQTQDGGHSPVDISGNADLQPEDLSNFFFGSWWVLLLLPAAILLWMLQLSMRRRAKEKPLIVKPKRSDTILAEAFREKSKTPAFYRLLVSAFLTRLAEKGEITPDQMTIEQLPGSGISGEVKQFLYEMEEKRFSGKEEDLNKAWIKQVQILFRKI
jgi:hypothetical protein